MALGSGKQAGEGTPEADSRGSSTDFILDLPLQAIVMLEVAKVDESYC